MLIRLDRHLCAEFLEQGVNDINVDIVSAGCAGSKIVIAPRITEDDRLASDVHGGIRCWVVPELSEKLDGAQIARAKGKLYIVSKKIESRCGCGTSFSFEKNKLSLNAHKIDAARKQLSQLRLIK